MLVAVDRAVPVTNMICHELRPSVCAVFTSYHLDEVAVRVCVVSDVSFRGRSQPHLQASLIQHLMHIAGTLGRNAYP